MNHNGNGKPKHAQPQRKYDYAGIFYWIVEYKRTHGGNSPSYQDIQREFSISSRSVVQSILRVLERGGFITLTWGDSRSIEIPGAVWTPPERV